MGMIDIMDIVIFEDENYQNLLPLVYFRPVWELRCGAFTLEERVSNYLEGNYFYIARDYLQKYYLDEKKNFRNISNENPILFINGRWLISNKDIRNLKELKPNEAIVCEDTVLAFQSSKSEIDKLLINGLPNPDIILNSMKSKEHKAIVVKFLWDIIDWNGECLVNDFKFLDKRSQINDMLSPGVHLIEKENIFISRTAQLKPGVVLDASEGPVWIDEGVTVMPNATLEGPVFIGKNSLIKIGAKLYGNTTIGPVCKIGGEVEECIIQGYSNKQHDGFLGHSYLGSWVNLGADTNNSDLKNNYGKIRVLLNGRVMDTGKQFLGLIMGDHSKTAINSMFNTGTIVGANCNIFGAGMPPRFVPSFSWGGADKLVEYRLDKIIEVAKLVMGRRNITFTDKDKQLFLEVKKLASQIEKITSR
jgi:UDP-N-acetylglucosamine diphosphorylase/glucosamine-1-phosphate N-acetyltransferase